MRQQFFIFIECDVGSAFSVAKAIKKRKLPYCTEIALVSGNYDILIRSECDSDVDVGRKLVASIQSIPHIKRTYTEIGYPIFDPADIYFDPEGD